MRIEIFFRYATRTIAGLIILFIIAWVVLWAYLAFNKKNVVPAIQSALSKKTNATIVIKDLDISLFHTFPFISLELDNVILRDSLWLGHHHDLLNAQKIFVQINPFKILLGKSPVSKILVENAKVYLYTDSAGYSNLNIFRKQVNPTQSGNPQYPDIQGHHIELIVEKKLNNKIFDLEFKQCYSSINEVNKVLFFDADLGGTMHRIIFKSENGSFLREKEFSLKCKVQFNLSDKILSFDDIPLYVDKHEFRASGKFFTALTPTPYQLVINTKGILYKLAASLLSDNIRKKLDEYNIDKPIDVQGSFDGSDPLLSSPVIHLTVNVAGAMVTTPFEIFSNSSFQGIFENRTDFSKPTEDENSVLRFKNFSGTAETIPLRSDSVVFTNLVKPQLRCNLRSEFLLEDLNYVFDSRDIEFEKGIGRLDVVYQGPIEAGDSIDAELKGNVSFDTASIKYLPKNFLLSRCSGKLKFLNKDVLIDELNGQVGSTQIKMNGGIKDLMALIDKNPEKLVLNWNIFSPKLNLHDFRSLMGKGTSGASHKKTNKFFTKQVTQIDNLLRSCDVQLQVKANELLYKKFYATNVVAALLLKNNTIMLDSVEMNNSGGSFAFSGFVKDDGTNNALNLHVTVNNVDVDKIFPAFENFGQDAITGKNIKGKLKADVNFSESLNAQQEVVPGSMIGDVEFSLRDGELIDFEPVENISKKIFSDRNFSDIRFGQLKDRFDINGSAIKMNRMEIESTAITLFVEGIYDTKKGTDLSIQVPLSNLKGRSDQDIPLNKGVKNNTGPSVRLRAKTGDDGKIKITWDPFKKALKDIKKTQAAASKK
jgi:AsmA-like C-terminal region/AsmA family